MTINWIPTMPEGDGPLYKRLADAIERDIFASRLKPGDKLPTHRDLADDLDLNVSTITRGYREAERRGLVSGTVGRGTFVSSDATTSSAMMQPEPQVPGMLDLGLITPLYELDPDMNEALARLARSKDMRTFLQYTSPAGLPEHREAGALWAREFGMPARAEDVVVCSGAQHALTCAFTSLFQPGDRIAVGSLTYPGFKSLASMLGLRLVPIPLDEEGIIPEGLDVACRRDDIKGVYLISSLHNPTTATASAGRLDALAEVMKQHGLIVVEDDTFAISGRGDSGPVSRRIPDQSVYVAGVSKVFCAGLRIAFVVAPKPLRRKLTEGVLNTVWMASTLNGAVISMWIKDGTAMRVRDAKLEEIRKRYKVAERMLQGFPHEAVSTGLFLWLHLPGPWTGLSFEARARELGVSVFAAEKFTVGDTPAPRAVRLSLTSTRTVAELEQGLQTIVDILNDQADDPLVIM